MLTAPPAECSSLQLQTRSTHYIVLVKPQGDPPYLVLLVPISQMGQVSFLTERSEPGTAPTGWPGEPVCFILMLSDLGSGLTFCPRYRSQDRGVGWGGCVQMS